MIKNWNEFNKLNENVDNTDNESTVESTVKFKDDWSGMSLGEMMKTSHTYKHKVACSLSDIICNERGISEKAFTALGDVSEELEVFYKNNQEEVDSLIENFDLNNWRVDYLAEKLYNKFFTSIAINEKKDFENVAKPEALKKKLKDVSLGKSKSGKYFVYSHRARCKYYDNPEDISQKDIDFIRSTN